MRREYEKRSDRIAELPRDSCERLSAQLLRLAYRYEQRAKRETEHRAGLLSMAKNAREFAVDALAMHAAGHRRHGAT